ncbi:MAG: 50S ribosomal protein L20 [Candidatus Magasanikbacteria bacterium]
MPRSTRGKEKNKKRRKLLRKAKGYRFDRKKKKKAAKQALMKAWKHAFAHRRKKKRNFRKLWNTKINAAVRQLGLNYSKFIHLLRENDVELNRKMLADLAENEPKVFEGVVEKIKE